MLDPLFVSVDSMENPEYHLLILFVFRDS